MNEQSSLYTKCPGCSESTLILHRGPQVGCAACGFDYAALAKDVPRFEAFLVETMRPGPAGQLAAIAIHSWTSTRGAEADAAAFRALAERHGIALPPPIDPNAFVRRILIGVGVFVVLLVTCLTYLVLGS